jgi:DNA polymerase-3 subunit delta'
MNIIGHDDAVAALTRSLAEGRLAHAYLFVGPDGVGKATLALALAKALNCASRRQGAVGSGQSGTRPPIAHCPLPTAPCNACSTCRRIDAGKHPDVECMRPGGICDEPDHDHSGDGSRDIRICQVRRAERVLGIAPFEGGRRVLIIDPADALNAQSADAFLKTLEEPPHGAVIVLVTANEMALPETVRSRCRRVALRALPAAETERVLRERFAAPPERAAALVRLFGGRIGRAVQALRDPDFDVRRAAMLDLAAETAAAALVDRFATAERLAEAYAKRERTNPGSAGVSPAFAGTPPPLPPADGKARSRADVFATLDIWIEWWRDLLLVAAGADALITHTERAAELRDTATTCDAAAALAGIQAVREARRDLEQNVNPRLALEAMMLRLPQAGTRHQAPGTRQEVAGNRS